MNFKKKVELTKIGNSIVNRASFFIKDPKGITIHVVEVKRLGLFEEEIREDERKKIAKVNKNYEKNQ